MINGALSFSIIRRRAAGLIAVGAAIALLGGCRTTSLEEIAPTNLVPPPTSATAAALQDPEPRIEPAEPDVAEPGPRATGAYPNINVVPKGETEQISDAEREAIRAELEAAKAEAKSSGGNGESEAEKLRRIAREHAEEALKEIEAE